MTAPPDDTTTNLHAVIAELQAERDAARSEKAALTEELAARTAELLERGTTFDERIEYQAATNDVLSAMSASPGDPQPVFDLIVERARDVCDAYGASVWEYDGTLIHLRASNGVSDDPSVKQAVEAIYPMAPSRERAIGRAILDGRIIRMDDYDADPGISPANRGITVKSTVVIPLTRAGEPIGGLGVGSRERGGFSDTQIELMKTFAEQAVIAITSAETYRALQTRTSDLQETLEYQTATSDVLKVISRSTFDLQPVLTTMAETATRLCAADQALIIRHENGVIQTAAHFGFPPEYMALLHELGPHQLVVDAPMVGYRAIVERCAVHVHDVSAVPGYADAAIKLGQQRTSLGVPLLRSGEPIGSILLARRRVEPFTDRQIELVNTFADQAVIAIENTRLITEQREALEQQTATAEVLQVINASPGNLAPVFDAMLEKALALCGSAFGSLDIFDGKMFQVVASRGLPAALTSYFQKPITPAPGSTLHRVVLGEDIVHVADLMDDDAYRSRLPTRVALVELGGARTQLIVSLRKDNRLIGVIMVYRKEVRRYTDRQIALLENFAAQAVIAMENARLLTEQREALEQQTATAEVLQVINANRGDLTPVFDAILDKAHTLCGAVNGSLVLFDGTHFRAAATHGFPEQVASLMRHPVPPNSRTQELIDGMRFRQIEDIRAIGINDDYLIMRALVEYTDMRTVLFVPLRKEGALRGFISAYRTEVRAFSDKEIALLENFAAQAVIATENARLLTEQREALEQQIRDR